MQDGIEQVSVERSRPRARHAIVAVIASVLMTLAALPIAVPPANANSIDFVDLEGGTIIAMELDGSGHPRIAYSVNVGFADWELRFVACGNVSCTSNNQTVDLWTTDSVGSVVMTLAPGGIPVIAFGSRPSQLVPWTTRVIRCGGPTCSAGNSIQIVDTDRGPSDIEVDGSKPLVLTGDDMLIHCGNASCSGTNTVTDFALFSSSTKLELTADDRPVIAYQATGGSSISVIECLDTACDDDERNVVDSSGQLGLSSFVLDDDQPVLTYTNSDGELVLARCTMTDCSSGITHETIVGFSFNGSRPRESSVDIGGNGRPTVGYYDDGGATLNAVYCGNKTCSNRTIYVIDDADSADGLRVVARVKNGGLPVFAYSALGTWGPQQNRLKVANCTSQPCGASATTSACEGLTPDFIATAGVPIVGTAGDDVMVGSGGDDIIDGAGGDDIICGREGDDQLRGGDGNDVIEGNAGDDIARGNAGEDNIEGNDGDDRLLGGTDGDVLTGGAGKDFIGGFGGDDMISGESGNDTIFGGFGADTIEGGGGADTISGLVGNDTILGGNGNDTLNGDRGADTVSGGDGNDTITGGNGNDTLRGNNGNDNLSGGKADDKLFGGAGNDTCTGNAETIADSADPSCEFIFGVP